MLELRSVWKRLGSFALADLSLEIRRGEYFVLLGPSGVGKTVLLEMLAGLIPLDRGQVFWNGRDMTRVAPEHRRFALVYQDYALFEHLSVARNIGYGLTARGVTGRKEAERVHQMAQRLGIESLLDRQVSSLSGGEKQRVALARALVTDPELVLLDEPLASLDNSLRLSLRGELKQLQKNSGATFLHVTHDLEEAMTLGHRVGVMLNQRLHQVGTPEELFRCPSDYEVARFLGMRNVLAVTTVRAGTCCVCGVEIDVADAGPSTRYVWIKPEEVLLSRQSFDSSARNQFPGTVAGWEHHGSLLAVQVAYGPLSLVALITHASFAHLEIEEGTSVFATFKSSAVHCF